MNEPLVEGAPVLIVLVLVRSTPLFGSAARRTQYIKYIGFRVRKAEVSSSVLADAPLARARRFGENIRPLAPDQEGISWCRGWSRESRDALSAAWVLAQGST